MVGRGYDVEKSPDPARGGKVRAERLKCSRQRANIDLRRKSTSRENTKLLGERKKDDSPRKLRRRKREGVEQTVGGRWAEAAGVAQHRKPLGGAHATFL